IRENFTGSARQGALVIGDYRQTIVQDGGLGDDCGYSVSPSFATYPASGGAGSLQVIAEERCAWQAVSAASWVTVSSGSVGIGNGVVTYTVAANAAAAGRSVKLTVAGKSLAVKQKG